VTDLNGTTAIVVGASRGLGRGIALALADAKASVVGVARQRSALDELAAVGAGIRTEAADASDSEAAWRLLDQYEPGVLALVAGANPVMRPLHHHNWDTFSANWNADVKIAFTWLREALLRPLPPGTRIVVFSSGAAIGGSPVSGGYAGAKAAQRFIAGYAQDESDRAGLGLTVTAVLPKITPHGAVGMRGIRSYAVRNGESEEAFLARLGDLLTPEQAGSAVLDLIGTDPAELAAGYVLTAAGLKELP
jgi:NAD(P)-dependent dehydrogenase (short-subunit alcohol dehydrogenase family)